MTLHVVSTGSGRPFVWAHGLTSSIAQEDESGVFDWSRLQGVQVIRYDALGHGRSPGPPDPDAYVWSRLADDMLEVAPAGRFVAGGASMGCATAIYAALEAPARIDALVLAVPPTAWETRAAQADQYENGASYIERRGLERYVERLRDMPPRLWTAFDPEIGFRHRLTMDETVLPSILRGAARSDLPHQADISLITAPTLILAWSDDPGHPLSTAEALAMTLPNSALHIARDADDVRDWPDAVAAFLATV